MRGPQRWLRSPHTDCSPAAAVPVSAVRPGPLPPGAVYSCGAAWGGAPPVGCCLGRSTALPFFFVAVLALRTLRPLSTHPVFFCCGGASLRCRWPSAPPSSIPRASRAPSAPLIPAAVPVVAPSAPRRARRGGVAAGPRSGRRRGAAARCRAEPLPLGRPAFSPRGAASPLPRGGAGGGAAGRCAPSPSRPPRRCTRRLRRCCASPSGRAGCRGGAP